MTLKGMDLAEPGPSRPRYDGHADWYDGWARAGGAAFMAAAGAALRELLPSGSGLALDLGCGTGLHAGVAAGRGYTLLGVDVSSDQLRLAQDRLPVLRADARALPFADGCFQAVYSMLTHTDLDGFAGLVREGLRVLAPDGRFCYVGVHPCFVGPFVEVEAAASRLHPGYREEGWQVGSPFIGDAVRRRVGVHHLTLQALLNALVPPGARLERVVERGDGPLPEVLGVLLSRPS